MRKVNLKILLALTFLITNVTYASGGGSSSKPLSGSYPIVLAHGTLGWGNGSTITDYWGGNAAYLRNQGATVFTPTVTSLESSSARATQLKTQILAGLAANNYTGKIHLIGHSQGGLDSRYMIANLGMASKIASLTTLNTPHYGSPIANIMYSVIPSWALPYVSTIVGTVVQVVLGQSNQNAAAALKMFTTANLQTFNANTPNNGSVKYFSYGSTISIPDLIQHPLMGLLQPICAIGGPFYGLSIANDGVVPDSSQRWGTWKGGPSIPLLTTGIDHLEAPNTLYLGQLWYDSNAYFLKMASNAKSNQ
ncbi:lipase family alpha/beta hydrolase [Leptospira kmetyi]|uniref:lipase family alpha/beta hydrolase n=1 Tax=Leptospira kmetyi TaxID=408139 RepID=UPI00108456D2|nr:alpha/beta fold hydrolase [Leptospira kmetyi]TGL71098.1 lipase [Leptospira kmetyi]